MCFGARVFLPMLCSSTRGDQASDLCTWFRISFVSWTTTYAFFLCCFYLHWSKISLDQPEVFPHDTYEIKMWGREIVGFFLVLCQKERLGGDCASEIGKGWWWIVCLLILFFLSCNLLSAKIMILLSSFWQKQLVSFFSFPSLQVQEGSHWCVQCLTLLVTPL